MLGAIRALSDDLVTRSGDKWANTLEQTLRTLERKLPRPDLASPYDWEGYGP